jgi:hypothetical protein
VAQASKLPLNRLEPAARARLLAALILLTILGIALVVLAWLALRVGRRSLRREDAHVRPRRGTLSPDDWASRPLVRSERNRPDQTPD